MSHLSTPRDKNMSETTILDLVIGEKYRWIYQKEVLVYLGKNWSSNGYWHQFALIEKPSTVWSEALDSDLCNIEKIS